MASSPSASGTLFSSGVLPCYFSNIPPSPLQSPRSSATLPQLPRIPSRTFLLCSLRMLPVLWHFPTHKIIVGVPWDSYSSSFHGFRIRTATSFLLIYIDPLLIECLKAHKPLKAQGKRCDCGVNAFSCSSLALSNKRGMGQTFPHFLGQPWRCNIF